MFFLCVTYFDFNFAMLLPLLKKDTGRGVFAYFMRFDNDNDNDIILIDMPIIIIFLTTILFFYAITLPYVLQAIFYILYFVF